MDNDPPKQALLTDLLWAEMSASNNNHSFSLSTSIFIAGRLNINVDRL
jgi:hypothetical protein